MRLRSLGSRLSGLADNPFLLLVLRSKGREARAPLLALVCVLLLGAAFVGGLLSAQALRGPHWPGTAHFRPSFSVWDILLDSLLKWTTATGLPLTPGRLAFWSATTAEILAALLFPPVIWGGGPGRSREGLDLLYSAPVTAGQICQGAFWALLAMTLSLLLCSLPFVALSIWLGGPKPVEALLSQALVLLVAAFASAITVAHRAPRPLDGFEGVPRQWLWLYSSGAATAFGLYMALVLFGLSPFLSLGLLFYAPLFPLPLKKAGLPPGCFALFWAYHPAKAVLLPLERWGLFGLKGIPAFLFALIFLSSFTLFWLSGAEDSLARALGGPQKRPFVLIGASLVTFALLSSGVVSSVGPAVRRSGFPFLPILGLYFPLWLAAGSFGFGRAKEAKALNFWRLSAPFLWATAGMFGLCLIVAALKGGRPHSFPAFRVTLALLPLTLFALTSLCFGALSGSLPGDEPKRRGILALSFSAFLIPPLLLNSLATVLPIGGPRSPLFLVNCLYPGIPAACALVPEVFGLPAGGRLAGVGIWGFYLVGLAVHSFSAAFALLAARRRLGGGKGDAGQVVRQPDFGA